MDEELQKLFEELKHKITVKAIYKKTRYPDSVSDIERVEFNRDRTAVIIRFAEIHFADIHIRPNEYNYKTRVYETPDTVYEFFTSRYTGHN